MKKIILTLKIIITFFIFSNTAIAIKANYFEEAIKLFNNEEYEKSKVLFERDIVFNPKSEKSYLYLAKIFKQNENDLEEEVNLTNVLTLNPNNEEAIYLTILLKIKQSDFNEASELIKKFDLLCINFCSKKKEVQEKLKKLSAANAKNKN